jgi:hypothetical protein
MAIPPDRVPSPAPKADPSASTSAAGEYCPVRSLPGGCPCVRLDHIEARGCQLVAEITYRPLICRDDRMIELFDGETIEEADQQGATRAEDSTELQERSADRVWLMVDQ